MTIELLAGLAGMAVAVASVVMVVAVAAPFQPSAWRRLFDDEPLAAAGSGASYGDAAVAARWGRRPVVAGGRGPPRALPTWATWAAVLLAGLALGLPGAAVVAMVAVVGPRWRRQRGLRRRLSALEAELPEVVDLLALAVRAGLTVPQALSAVAARGGGLVCAELAVAVAEVGRGRRLADALDELPDRAGEPTRPLAATLAACERYGVPVVDALERVAGEARDRQRRRAEQSARRLPVLLLFPMVACILPAFALLAIVPLIADAVPALRP